MCSTTLCFYIGDNKCVNKKLTEKIVKTRINNLIDGLQLVCTSKAYDLGDDFSVYPPPLGSRYTDN